MFRSSIRATLNPNVASIPTVANCVFTNNAAITGGRIYIENLGASNPEEEVQISSCTFMGNSAAASGPGSGGGINAVKTQLAIVSCSFENNVAMDNGGGAAFFGESNVVISNSIFTGNIAQDGGGIKASGSELNVGACLFDSNQTTQGGFNPGPGGGISLIGGILDITNSDFINNSASSGGAISGEGDKDPVQVSMWSCEFRKNSAQDSDGGALYFLRPSSVFAISHCTFGDYPDEQTGETFGNTAVGSGGAIRVDRAPSGALIEVSAFIDNHAESNAGAVLFFGAPMSLEWCDFLLNSADLRGGAIYAEPEVADKVVAQVPNIEHCAFIGNEADFEGGAIGSERLFPWVSNCLFTGNQAGGEGGGVYIIVPFAVGTWPLIEIESSTFSQNTGVNTGGIYVDTEISSVRVTNAISWKNNDSTVLADQLSISAPSFEVRYSCVNGISNNGGSFNNNINADPQFVDFDGVDNTVGTVDDNLRLLGTSPCIDSGNDSDAQDPPILLDLDWNSRVMGAVIDIGAYEFVQ